MTAENRYEPREIEARWQGRWEEESTFRASNPGDIVATTGLPRYLVLASFQLLEELGFIKCIYCKGSHKVYTLTPKGEEYLEETLETTTPTQTGEATA